MAADGHEGARELVDTMALSVLGSRLDPALGVMAGLVSLLAKGIWMAEPSVPR
jgi:hypothetical protein